MPYSVVLSDELLKEYYAFKNNESFDNLTIKSLLTRYKPHITNVEQLERTSIEDTGIIQTLLSSSLTTQTLEELSELTKYKIILHQEKTNYPYINIFKDEIENNYSATYYKDIPRDKAREHIKALVKNAERIFLYDSYIDPRWNDTKKFFTDLLPKKSLFIYHIENHLSSKKRDIESICSNWKVKEGLSNRGYTDSHDRYIRIDDKIEIILTSGFDYLFDESKDFTYIVRDIEQVNSITK